MPPSLVQAELRGAQGHTLHKLLPLPQMPSGVGFITEMLLEMVVLHLSLKKGRNLLWGGVGAGRHLPGPANVQKCRGGDGYTAWGSYWRDKARVYGSWPPGSLEYQGKFCFHLYIMLQENQVL